MFQPTPPSSSPQKDIEFFRALASETRLKIMTLLHHESELSAGLIRYELGASQPNAAYHLGILKCAGLVAVRYEEQRSYYKLNLTDMGSHFPWWGQSHH